MRKNWDIGPILMVMIEAQVVSLSTSLFLLKSQYGRMNSNLEKLGPTKERNNRSSGPTLILMIETQLVSLSTSLFLLES